MNKNSIPGVLEGPNAPCVRASKQYPARCEGTEAEEVGRMEGRTRGKG